jgi:LysR family glycine cleavage system transcriptional activator
MVVFAEICESNEFNKCKLGLHMDWRDLPPLAALRAFTAFAQCGSLVEAGDALGVSHAAVSQQLRLLEQHLNFPLLDRSNRALRLTPQGELLAKTTTMGFEKMAGVCRDLKGVDADRPLHVTTSPTFAASWLMPNLPEFRAENPEIDILIDPTPSFKDPVLGGVDLGVRYGTGPWDGLENMLWMPSSVVVVASPKLLQGRETPSPEEMRALPWLEELGHTEGSDWLRNQGVDEQMTGGRIQVPGNLLLQGVLDGQGLAVTVDVFVSAAVKAGRLVVVSKQSRLDAGYHLVTLPGVHRPPLRKFLRWLKQRKPAN